MKFPVYSELAARYAFSTLPHLSMDEYALFVADLLAQADPEKVARQKALEERIAVPFRIIPDDAGRKASRQTPSPGGLRSDI